MNRGTPATLTQALADALIDAKDLKPEQMVPAIRDFLAQKFSVAMLKHPEATDALQALFDKITGEEK